ncbi:36971_t:CDS:2 [Racocetra persica]|uniref:36971_t:CDS:1 n=1 Tax=Racocetra persica TaxID=160502 RepID=A0ACA9P826_9GLOM|nr:36971_t:CDS:2 [Racocetra persica]
MINSNLPLIKNVNQSSFDILNCKRRLDQFFIYANINTNQVLLTIGRNLKSRYLKQIKDVKLRPHKIRRDFWKPIIAVTGFSSYGSVTATTNIVQDKLDRYPKPPNYKQTARKIRQIEDMDQIDKSVCNLCYALNKLGLKGMENNETSRIKIFWEREALKYVPAQKAGLEWPRFVVHKKLFLDRGRLMMNSEFGPKPFKVRQAYKEAKLKEKATKLEERLKRIQLKREKGGIKSIGVMNILIRRKSIGESKTNASELNSLSESDH